MPAGETYKRRETQVRLQFPARRGRDNPASPVRNRRRREQPHPARTGTCVGGWIVAPSKTERLAEILRKAGAEVELRWRDAGLTKGEVGEARKWLSERIGYDWLTMRRHSLARTLIVEEKES